MNANIRRQLDKRKRRIERRLDKTQLGNCDRPMFTACNIHYEIADRTRGLAHGGIGALHLLARRIGLIDAINDQLHLLKIHLPYHESDHVLNLAYNALCDGTCLQDLELRRQDEVYLDALGARRIPDPTTAGDFCRRFRAADVHTLIDIANQVRHSRFGAAAGRVLRRSHHRHGWHAGRDHRRMQGRHGYRLRWHLGLPSAGGLAGQHRRSPERAQPARQSTLARRRRRRSGSCPAGLSGGGLSSGAVAWRHRLQPDQASGSLGGRFTRAFPFRSGCHVGQTHFGG